MEILVQVAVTAAMIVAAAGVVEAVIEYIFAPFVNKLLPQYLDAEDPTEGTYLINRYEREMVFHILSAGLGILVAFNWRIGVFTLFGFHAQFLALDYVLTGVLIGRGSNKMHEWLERFTF